MFRLSFSKKQIIINILRLVIVITAFSLGAYFLLGLSIKEIIARKSWLDRDAITAVFFFVTGFLIAVIETNFLRKLNLFIDKTIYNLQNALKGNLGEKKTFERLEQMLGSSYRLYRNFKIPGSRFDIDAVIVGSKGIITFEVKNLGGEGDKFLFEDNETYKITRYPNGNICSCQLNYLSNPINEASRHNQALEEWLMKNDFEKIKVKGAILMVGYSKVEIKKPSIYVITSPDGIKEFFEDAFEDKRFTSEFCDKLNRLFSENS